MARTTIAALLAFLFVAFAASAFETPEELPLDIPGITPEIQATYDEALDSVRRGDLAEAIVSMQTMLSQFQAAYGDSSEYLATPLTYLGLTQFNDGQHAVAETNLSNAVDLIERVWGPYDARLVPVLHGLGLVHIGLEDTTAAKDALRRAQHITHRHGGVYTGDQLALVERLTDLESRFGNSTEVDRQQLFYLKVHEDLHGEGDAAMIPALNRLGHYMSRRAVRFKPEDFRAGLTKRHFFRSALEYYRRSIALIEEHYGDQDRRLIEPLNGIARTRYRQRAGKKDAAEALTRVVEIEKAHAADDIEGVVLAAVSLGDLYTRWNDIRALDAYRDAWNLIPDTAAFRPLRDDLFGEPVRLTGTTPDVLPLRRRPMGEGVERFAEIEYQVRSFGWPSKVRIVGGDVPPRVARWLRSTILSSRFRPRMVDGEVVRTEGMTLRQLFAYEG